MPALDMRLALKAWSGMDQYRFDEIRTEICLNFNVWTISHYPAIHDEVHWEARLSSERLLATRTARRLDWKVCVESLQWVCVESERYNIVARSVECRMSLWMVEIFEIFIRRFAF